MDSAPRSAINARPGMRKTESVLLVMAVTSVTEMALAPQLLLKTAKKINMIMRKTFVYCVKIVFMSIAKASAIQLMRSVINMNMMVELVLLVLTPTTKSMKMENVWRRRKKSLNHKILTVTNGTMKLRLVMYAPTDMSRRMVSAIKSAIIAKTGIRKMLTTQRILESAAHAIKGTHSMEINNAWYKIKPQKTTKDNHNLSQDPTATFGTMKPILVINAPTDT